MVRGIGIILLAAGIAALVHGIKAASHLHAAVPFESKPDNQLMWFYIGGITGIVIGAAMAILPSRKP